MLNFTIKLRKALKDFRFLVFIALVLVTSIDARAQVYSL